MKVLISADMEGTCGVVSWVHVMPPEYVGNSEPSNQSEYDRARLRMTREVNAAIEGALEAGADEVIVNDSHDGMRNLIPEQLHPECRFIAGNDKPLGMMQGVDLEGIGAAVLYRISRQGGYSEWTAGAYLDRLAERCPHRRTINW